MTEESYRPSSIADWRDVALAIARGCAARQFQSLFTLRTPRLTTSTRRVHTDPLSTSGLSGLALVDDHRRRHPDSIDRQPAVTLLGRLIGIGPTSGGSDTGFSAAPGVRKIIRRKNSINGFSNQR